MGNVPGFLPSKNGLHYSNRSWSSVPDITIPVQPFGTITLGDASNGLCGGMVFAVRDLFDASVLPPPSASNPPGGSPAFNYIVQRLLDSFNVPAGVLEYYTWMQLPAHDDEINFGNNIITIVTGTSNLTINQSMPTVRATIDPPNNQPCPLGLVCLHSTDPTQLGQNHQVLAWGYEDIGATTTVRIYDPNWPDRDDVTITFDHTDPTHTTTFNYSTRDLTVLGFFPASWYQSKDPSPLGDITVNGTVPDVVGLAPATARASIQTAGFQVSEVGDPIVGSFPPYVEFQNPDGGSVEPLQTTVTITIATPVKGHGHGNP